MVSQICILKHISNFKKILPFVSQKIPHNVFISCNLYLIMIEFHSCFETLLFNENQKLFFKNQIIFHDFWKLKQILKHLKISVKSCTQSTDHSILTCTNYLKHFIIKSISIFSFSHLKIWVKIWGSIYLEHLYVDSSGLKRILLW